VGSGAPWWCGGLGRERASTERLAMRLVWSRAMSLLLPHSSLATSPEVAESRQAQWAFETPSRARGKSHSDSFPK